MFRLPSFESRWAINILVSLVAALAVFALSQLQVFQNLELKTLDARFGWRGKKPAGSEIVIVAIDDDSWDSLPEKWPWPRTYHAKLVENLNRAGAKVIAFDLEFDKPSPTNPEQDEIFAQAIRKAGNVVLGGKILSERRKVTFTSLIKPLPKLLEGGGSWGFVNMPEDADGFVRRYPLTIEHGGGTYLPLGLEALKRYLGSAGKAPYGNSPTELTLGKLHIPKYDYNSMLINYAGPAGSFPTYSYWLVLDDENFQIPETASSFDLNAFNELLKDEVFKDKIVFVGATLEELHDLFPTPFYEMEGRKQTTPGVEIHAHAIRTILEGDFLYRLGLSHTLLILLALGLVTGLAMLRLKSGWGLAFIIGEIFIYIILAFFIFTRYNWWVDVVGPVGAVIFSYFGNVFYQYMAEQKEKRVIKGIFQHYVTKAVVDQLLENPDMVKLGGDKKVLTAFFSDVAGFTTISEQLAPEELVFLLNEYLTVMTEIVFKYDGMLDKYEGDAIMAVFGAPIPQEDHARRACFASLDMQRELEKLRERWKGEGKPELRVRIGLNTGLMIIGNMGSRERMDYTVMGDSVNLASRLEGANKQYGTDIMISEFTYEHVRDDVEARELDAIRVKGKAEPVKVYEVLARKSDGLPEKKRKVLEAYNRGLELYKNRRWDEAMETLTEALTYNPDDGPSKIYLERCQEFKENPPPEDWDGVFTMAAK